MLSFLRLDVNRVAQFEFREHFALTDTVIVRVGKSVNVTPTMGVVLTTNPLLGIDGLRSANSRGKQMTMIIPIDELHLDEESCHVNRHYIIDKCFFLYACTLSTCLWKESSNGTSSHLDSDSVLIMILFESFVDGFVVR